jgi:hypothetical protein
MECINYSNIDTCYFCPLSGPVELLGTSKNFSGRYDGLDGVQRGCYAMFLYGLPVRAASICTTTYQTAQYHGLHGFDDYDSELIIGVGAGER